MANPSFDQLADMMIWQDDSFNVWLAQISPLDGTLYPQNGAGKLIDTQAADPQVTGNTGMFADGLGLPAAVWSRNLSGVLSLGEAVQDSNQVWTMSNVTNASNRWKPEGTHENWIGPAMEAYNYQFAGQLLVAARQVGNASSEIKVSGLVPNQGGRWIEGENALIVSMVDGSGIKQVGVVDLTQPNPHAVQVTFESQDTFNAYSWIAPEYNAPVFSAMIGNQTLGIFRQNADKTWTKVYSFGIPSTFPYLSSPEGFVVNGKSYVFVVAMKTPGIGRFPYQPVTQSQIWIAGIDPTNAFFRRIDDPTRATVKAEPEVYFVANGPGIYYGEKQPNGYWMQRFADTGLGTDWGYDSSSYAGPWAASYRDNKNCSCAPFPVGDGYTESTAIPITASNRQTVNQVMGPQGYLYAAIPGTSTATVTAYDTATAAKKFTVDGTALGGSVIGNGLVANNGDVFVAGNSAMGRYSAAGAQVWTTPLRGAPPALQYAPDGNVMAFTFNGWFQVFDPSTGQLLVEQNLMPGFPSGSTPHCAQGLCAFVTSPAMDPRASRIFLIVAGTNGTTKLRSYSYNAQTHAVSLAWDSTFFTGTLSPPVLSADYTRVYFQSPDGKLYAYDAATGAPIWTFDLQVATQSAPVVSEFGYILPGMCQTDSQSVCYVGIVKDNGSSASWAFKTTAYAAQSVGAVGRGNRFVLLANRASDHAQVLLVVNPQFGVVSQTPLTINPLPSQSNSVIVDQKGWVYVGTWGASSYRAFSPTYETVVR